MRDTTASATTSYYDVLQVSPTASQEVIQAAYRALARSCHPDVNPSTASAQRMQMLNNAYRVLGDTQRRAQYDLWRTRASRSVARPFPKPVAPTGMRGRPGPHSPKRIEEDRADRTTWRPLRSRIVLLAVMLVMLLVLMSAALWLSSSLLDDVPDADLSQDVLATASGPVSALQGSQPPPIGHLWWGVQPLLNHA